MAQKIKTAKEIADAYEKLIEAREAALDAVGKEIDTIKNKWPTLRNRNHYDMYVDSNKWPEESAPASLKKDQQRLAYLLNEEIHLEELSF